MPSRSSWRSRSNNSSRPSHCEYCRFLILNQLHPCSGRYGSYFRFATTPSKSRRHTNEKRVRFRALRCGHSKAVSRRGVAEVSTAYACAQRAAGSANLRHRTKASRRRTNAAHHGGTANPETGSYPSSMHTIFSISIADRAQLDRKGGVQCRK